MRKGLMWMLIPCVMLLGACTQDGIDGTWELAQEEQNECPIYYKFETVVTKDEDEEEQVEYVVSMYTNERTEDDYSEGTYTLTEDGSYFLDYGSSFTSKQEMEVKSDELYVFFEEVGKTCVYEGTEK